MIVCMSEWDERRMMEGERTTAQALTDASPNGDDQQENDLCDNFRVNVLLQFASLCPQTSVVEEGLSIVTCMYTDIPMYTTHIRLKGTRNLIHYICTYTHLCILRIAC